MSSASSILNDLLFKSKRLENKLQDLERRLKQAERTENPLGILEPDIDFLISGEVVNCTFRNMIDENEPDKNFQEDGRVDFGFAPKFDLRICLLKFEKPVQNVKAMTLRFNVNPRILFIAEPEGKFKFAEFAVQAVPTKRLWNPSDVTFNSYNPSEIIDINFEAGFEFTGNITNKTGDFLLTNALFVADSQAHMLGGIPLGRFDSDGPYNGVEVRMQLRNFTSEKVSGVRGTCEMSIEVPFSTASSFVVTL